MKIAHINNNKNMIERSIRPIADFCGHKIWTRFKFEKVDMICCHSTRSSCLPLFLGWLSGIKIRVYHNHGFPFLGHKGLMRFILHSMEKWNIFFATHVTCVSYYNLREAKIKGTIIHNGSACGVVENPYPVRDNPEKLIFGYIGRPVKRKGFYLMLDAWEKSELARRGHMLWIAGCHAEGENVKSFGHVANIEKFIAKCDVICLPSFHEGLPNILLESMAAGKTVIASRIAGNRDIIFNNINGFLHESGDIDGLVNCLHKALRANLNTMGSKGKKFVLQKFNRNDVLEAYKNYYMELTK